MGEKKLSNTNLVVSRRIKREKASLPVDVRRSKTSLLKLPIMLRRERLEISLTVLLVNCHDVTSRIFAPTGMPKVL